MRGDGRPCGAGAAGRFQFTPLREGRPTLWDAVFGDITFQFTPLREGRRGRAAFLLSPLLFQFTPLREGRRKAGFPVLMV